jgi:hypothetical protein
MNPICRMAERVGGAFSEFFALFLPPFAIVVVVALLCIAVMRIMRLTVDRVYLPFLLAFCLVGVIPGVIAGYSQEAIAGAFLSATVGIVSALLSYAFAKDTSDLWRPVIPFAIIATLLGALAGYGAGRVERFKWIQFDELAADRRAYNDQVFTPVERERQLHNLVQLKALKKGAISRGELAALNFPPAPPTPPDKVPNCLEVLAKPFNRR